MLLILFYLSVRLQELNFEVKVYENYKQEEVLDKIGEGSHSEVGLIGIEHIHIVTSQTSDLFHFGLLIMILMIWMSTCIALLTDTEYLATPLHIID